MTQLHCGGLGELIWTKRWHSRQGPIIPTTSIPPPTANKPCRAAPGICKPRGPPRPRLHTVSRLIHHVQPAAATSTIHPVSPRPARVWRSRPRSVAHRPLVAILRGFSWSPSILSQDQQGFEASRLRSQHLSLNRNLKTCPICSIRNIKLRAPPSCESARRLV